jgi:hypothetical protein
MPGSLLSSSTSFWTVGLNAGRDPPELAVGQFLRGPQRLVGGGQDHILEHLHIFRVHRGWVDLDALDLDGARHLHRHHAAARGRLDHLVGQVLLHLGHVGLHLLDLLHHLVVIGVHCCLLGRVWRWGSVTGRSPARLAGGTVVDDAGVEFLLQPL